MMKNICLNGMIKDVAATLLLLSQLRNSYKDTATTLQVMQHEGLQFISQPS